MTSKSSYDLVLLSCNWKRIQFPVDSGAPTTPQTTQCCFTILSLMASVWIIIFPSFFSLHLWALYYFLALILFYCHSWKLSHNFLTALFKGHQLTLLLSLVLFPAPFSPLPLGRPLVQHTQHYIPQAVGAPSKLHTHSRPLLSAARGASKPWPQLPPGLANESFDWWKIAI